MSAISVDRLDDADLIVDQHHRDQQHPFVELAAREPMSSRPSRPTGRTVRSMPCSASHSQLSSTAACSVATVMIRLRPLGAFSTVPLSAQFNASVALPVKATLPAFETDRLLDLAARDLDRGFGFTPPARRRMRIGELFLDPRTHRLGDFGRHRRRRLIIEVDHAARAFAGFSIRATPKEAVDIRLAGRRVRS